MEGLYRWIKLALDKKAAQDVEREAKEALDKGTDPKVPVANLKKVEGGLDRLKKLAKPLAAAFAAAFSVRAITRFFRSSLDAANALEDSRRRLAATLRNEGIQYEAVQGQIQAYTKALWESHRLTEGEVNPILQQLVLITGDYEKSLRAVGVAADLAAATNMDVQSAAKLLGRVMNGEVGALRRYGIALEEGADALQVLEDRLSGMAKAATPPTVALSKAYGDLQEAIGLALKETINFDTNVDRLITVVKFLEENIRTLIRAVRDLIIIIGVTGAVRAFAGFRLAMLATSGVATTLIAKLTALRILMGPKGLIIAGISAIIIGFMRLRDRTKDLARAAEEAEKAFKGLLATADLETLRAEQALLIRQIGAIDKELERLGDTMDRPFIATSGRVGELRGQLDLLRGRYNEITEVIRELGRAAEEVQLPPADLEGATGEAIARPVIGPVRIGPLLGVDTQELAAESRRLIGTAIVQNIIDMMAPLNAEIQDQYLEMLEQQDRALQEMEARQREAARRMIDAIQPFFDGLAMSFLGIEKLGASLVESFAGLGAEIVAQLIEGKAEMSMAEAISALAQGTWPPNPAALKAAALHMSAAAAYRAISGKGAAVGRGMRADSMPMPGSSMRPSVDSRGMTDINIYIDGVDPRNPRHQELVATSVQEYRERTGQRIRVQPRRTGSSV